MRYISTAGMKMVPGPLNLNCGKMASFQIVLVKI